MSFSEFIGFLITMLVFIYLSSKRVADERRRRRDPEQYERERQQSEEVFKEFMRSLQIEVESDQPQPFAKPPPPPPVKKARAMEAPARAKPKDKFDFHSNLDGYQQKSHVEGRHIHSAVEDLQGNQLMSKRMAQLGVTAHQGYKQGASRARKALDALPDAKRMVVLHEIFSRPKALSTDKELWEP